jgi:hypothetical protein
MSGNLYIKQRIAAGLLCYICEKARPTRRDDVGGNVCQECYTHMKTTKRAIALKGGYHTKKETTLKKDYPARYATPQSNQDAIDMIRMLQEYGATGIYVDGREIVATWLYESDERRYNADCEQEKARPQTLWALLQLLYDLALDKLNIDASQVIGTPQFDLDLDPITDICTIDINGQRVCLWSLSHKRIWSAYAVVPLDEQEERNETERIEASTNYWEERKAIERDWPERNW